MSDETFQPVPMAKMPRFAGPATFMRLPQIADPARVDIALVGVPFDGGTTNRAGARHGPRQMREMSTLIRRVHPVSFVEPFKLCRCADLGDVPLNPIDLASCLSAIEAFFTTIVAAGAVPLAAGGDHLITLPILRALTGATPGLSAKPTAAPAAGGRKLGLVHFDAHSDTTDFYFGGSRYTHGTPFRRAVEEGLIDAKRSIQIGIRSSLHERSDLDWPRQAGFRIVTMEEFEAAGPAAIVAEARRVIGSGPAYVSFDVDGLDPAFAPGTGTPEVGGLTPREAFALLRGLAGLDLIGGDVVEVAPPFDVSGNTALVGATIMFEILCLLAEARTRRRA